MHIKDFKSKPTEKELYDLLEKWNFNFYRGDVKTMEAGIDEKLWLEVFGFDIDAKRLTTKNNEQHLSLIHI